MGVGGKLDRAAVRVYIWHTGKDERGAAMIISAHICAQPLSKVEAFASHSLGIDATPLPFLDMRMPFELYRLQTSKYCTVARRAGGNWSMPYRW